MLTVPHRHWSNPLHRLFSGSSEHFIQFYTIYSSPKFQFNSRSNPPFNKHFTNWWHFKADLQVGPKVKGRKIKTPSLHWRFSIRLGSQLQSHLHLIEPTFHFYLQVYFKVNFKFDSLLANDYKMYNIKVVFLTRVNLLKLTLELTRKPTSSKKRTFLNTKYTTNSAKSAIKSTWKSASNIKGSLKHSTWPSRLESRLERDFEYFTSFESFLKKPTWPSQLQSQLEATFQEITSSV